MIGKCVRCKQLRGQLQQNLANFSKDRMCIETLFTYCDLDIFGPFLVKDDRKEVVLYTPVFPAGQYLLRLSLVKHRFVHLEFKTLHWAKRKSKDDQV